jgi:hypothetical protein
MIPKRSLQRFLVYHFVRHIAFGGANAEQNSLLEFDLKSVSYSNQMRNETPFKGKGRVLWIC